MRNFVKKIVNICRLFGIDLVKFVTFWRGLPFIIKDFCKLKKQIRLNNITVKASLNNPHPHERHTCAGVETGHYFNQDLLVAEKIALRNPRRHVDVGSSIYGFVSHIASFRNIECFDIRPLAIDFPQIKFIQCDIMAPLPDYLLEYSDSVSCLHALEHFGLGRYDDPVNIKGPEAGLKNLAAIVKQNGTLYLSVPIGPERIEFNAHWVLAVRTVLVTAVKYGLALKEISYVDDTGMLHRNIAVEDAEIDNNLGCVFGCGIFEFIKE